VGGHGDAGLLGDRDDVVEETAEAVPELFVGDRIAGSLGLGIDDHVPGHRVGEWSFIGPIEDGKLQGSNTKIQICRDSGGLSVRF